jgi:8-oxo-dGTP pyrophosphatase MutT (NUDIX family)
MRELEEEAGVTLTDPGALVPFARWITPEQVKVRYDTWFYLALAPAHSSPEPDGEEIVETAWLTPADALARHERSEMLLVFPTIHKLEVLARYANAEEALAAARDAQVEPILPRVDSSGDEPRILLPGDWGY